MNNIKYYDEYVNEEFGWKDVKKVALGAGIFALLCVGGTSCGDYSNIAYNVTKQKEIKNNDKKIAKGKVVHVKRWSTTTYNPSTKIYDTDYSKYDGRN